MGVSVDDGGDSNGETVIYLPAFGIVINCEVIGRVTYFLIAGKVVLNARR